MTNPLRRAQIDGVWGYHPDREELLSTTPALPVPVAPSLTATTSTTNTSQLDSFQDSDHQPT